VIFSHDNNAGNWFHNFFSMFWNAKNKINLFVALGEQIMDNKSNKTNLNPN